MVVIGTVRPVFLAFLLPPHGACGQGAWTVEELAAADGAWVCDCCHQNHMLGAEDMRALRNWVSYSRHLNGSVRPTRQDMMDIPQLARGQFFYVDATGIE